jgi:hypothetical protein
MSHFVSELGSPLHSSNTTGYTLRNMMLRRHVFQSMGTVSCCRCVVYFSIRFTVNLAS